MLTNALTTIQHRVAIDILMVEDDIIRVGCHIIRQYWHA